MIGVCEDAVIQTGIGGLRSHRPEPSALSPDFWSSLIRGGDQCPSLPIAWLCDAVFNQGNHVGLQRSQLRLNFGVGQVSWEVPE